MKHYGLICVSLMLAVFVCAPLFSQPSTQSVETRLLDNFDVPADLDWSWGVQASNSVYVNEEEGAIFPKMRYVPAMPNSLQLYRVEGDPEPQVLGIEVRFDRKGDNWFEIYPQKADENGEMKPYEPELKGDVTQIDFWIWGANYLYYLDVLVRDANGQVHILNAGDLAFDGWRNVIVTIPKGILQHSRLRSGPKYLTFVGFRIRTDPKEYVDEFRIFFDQLRYSTNTLSNIFDGFDLGETDFDDIASDASTVEGGTN